MQNLEQFKNDVNASGKNVYVGQRYVPKILGDWNKSKTYEALSIVQYQGNSFTSRQPVPTGIEITNEEFWVSTGNYNAQIEQYRQDVKNVNDSLNGLNNIIQDTDSKIKGINTKLDNLATVNVKDFGAKGDGVTDDTESVKAAIAYACSFAKGTGWKEEVPTVYFPAGKYIISEPQALNPTVTALRGYNISGEGYLNTIIKYTYNGTEADNHLMINGGKSWWGFSYIQDLTFEGNKENNIWCIKSMNGSPQANRFLRVNFRNINKAVTVLYGSVNANADLFRFESCKASSINGWVFGVDSTLNSQSVVHSFVNCDFEGIYGRILYFKSGGEVTVIGGSWIVSGNGRIIECVDKTGSGIGNQNNQFTFHGTKFEWQGSENRLNDETYPLSYSDSYASILFYRCNFGQYTNAISESYNFSRLSMGELIFEKCFIPKNMLVKLTKNNGENLGVNTPTLILESCKVAKSIDETANIETIGGNNNIKWHPIVKAINCSSLIQNIPVDVDLSGVANSARSMNNTKKIFRYTDKQSSGDGLPNTNKTFKLPVGATLTKIYLYVNKVSSNGYGYTYNFKDSNGNLLHTAYFMPSSSKGGYISSDLYLVVKTESESIITIEVESTSPVAADGYIDFEYI